MTASVPSLRPAAGLADLRGRIVAGAPTGDVRALPPRVQRAVRVAVEVGAPLVPALDAATAALDDERRRERAVHVATAQARAVAVGLLCLPVVLVPGLGRLLAVDLVGFYATGPGRVVLAVAAGLAGLGALLVRGILRRATRARRGGSGRAGPAVLAGAVVAIGAGAGAGLVAGVVVMALRRPAADGSHPELDEIADLLATALAGGTSVSAALRLVGEVGVGERGRLDRLALAADLGRLDEGAVGPLAPLAQVLAATRRWGSPAAASLRALARDLRAEQLADALAAAERLPAQLTVPTALCLLPASVLLLGAPLVADALAHAGGW